MKVNSRLMIGLILIYIFTLSSASALKMNRRRMKAVKTVTMRLLSQLITQKMPIVEPATTITITDREIGHMRVSSAKLVVQDLTSQLRNSIAKGKIRFDKLAKRVKIQANATFLENDIQYFIDYKIRKLRFRHRIFPKAKISIKSGHIETTGKVILKKIPGNYLAFLSNEPAPFKVRFKLVTHKRKLKLEIIDGVVNGQTITQEFKNQVESWINPIWNFTKADFKADLNSINISAGKISLSGTMF